VPGKLSSAFKNLFCLTGATACSALPTVYSALTTADPAVGALAGLGLGGATVLGNLLTGRLGQLWNEILVERMTDPQTVVYTQVI
jgi:hypothetical protein